MGVSFPGPLFDAFHGVPLNDPEGFLYRCGANWAAFFAVQFVAFWRWRMHHVWLAVVAGVRLSDIFTDATYVLAAEDVTLFAKLTLAPMSAINLLLGVYLLRGYFSRERTRTERSASQP